MLGNMCVYVCVRGQGEVSDLKCRELTPFYLHLMQHEEYEEYKTKFSLYWYASNIH